MMSTRQKRRNRSLVIGFAVLALLLLAVRLSMTATNGVPGSARTEVTATVKNTGSLQKGDDVRIAETRVGQINSISLADGRPQLGLSLEGDWDVYRDATVVIGQRSPLGQNFVSLFPGTPAAGKLDESAVIAEVKDGDTPDLTNLLDVFDAKTRVSLQNVVGQVGAGSNGQSDNLNAALDALPAELPALGKVSRALSTRDGDDLTRLLTATDRVSKTFAGQQEQIALLLGNTDKTLAALNIDHGEPLAKTLDVAPGALERLRATFISLNGPLADTEAAMRRLQPAARALGTATPSLRGLLREAVGPLEKVSSVMSQAEKPVDKLTQVIADARPLAPRLQEAVNRAATPLGVLAPYAPEISLFFTNASSALGQGDRNGHWLRLIPVLSTSAVSLPGVKDPLVKRNPYPAPGQAGQDDKSNGGSR